MSVVHRCRPSSAVLTVKIVKVYCDLTQALQCSTDMLAHCLFAVRVRSLLVHVVHLHIDRLTIRTPTLSELQSG